MPSICAGGCRHVFELFVVLRLAIPKVGLPVHHEADPSIGRKLVAVNHDRVFVL